MIQMLISQKVLLLIERKSRDVVSIEMVNYKQVDLKENNFQNKIPHASSLIFVNKCNTDKQSLGNKQRMLIKKQDVTGLVAASTLNTKIGVVENNTECQSFSDYHSYCKKNWRS